MTYQPLAQFPILKGLVASNQPLAQPKGSFPRGSNLIMIERGALTPCDGSAIINWFNGLVQANNGRFMSLFLFEPTGVNPYYLAIKKLQEALGTPIELTSVASAGGSLTSGVQLFYKVTALDGLGHETAASNETVVTPSGGNLSVTLSWNIVPNAFAYNVYRGTTLGGELLLAGGGLPTLQPSTIAPLVTFIDTGAATPASPAPLTMIGAASGGVTPGHSTNLVIANVSTTPNLNMIGQPGTISGNSNPTLNVSGTIVSVSISGGGGGSVYMITSSTYTSTAEGSGGTLATGGFVPPTVDSGTQQTALYVMPQGIFPVVYSDANIAARFPATLDRLGQVPTGGTGGQGLPGPGIPGQPASTCNGGITGLVGPLPQFKQFTNRAIIALGNGFSMQMYSDATGTAVNPAFTGAITSVAVLFDQVTVTTSAVLTAAKLPVGSSVILSMSDPTYNGTFTVLAVNTGAGTFVIRNTAASGGASTGTFTVTTTPIISTFVPAYPEWITNTAYAVGDIIVPVTQPTPNIYLTATQPGVSAGSEPTWTSKKIGDQVRDGSIIWTVTALLNSSAPPPPGAAHIEIYAGSLWVLNTSPSNTANGLDGPCCLRMSNTNNPNGWNPVNQAFLDKDDGSEGMGMGKFTITAQGIPPEGSLIAFKYRVPYQIIGVFGANNFAIQPVSSDMGCLAPRSIVFVPGYGLMRYCHLGIAVFDGWRDQVVSEQIRPYLFNTNAFDARDIVSADANFLPLSWAAQTANPPMYGVAIPIGNSGGKLTRIMCYDLVLKAWTAPIDLPFAIGCMAQVQPITSNPLTLFGGFSDGALQRWQAGDVNWYANSVVYAQEVAWSLQTNTVASQNSSQRIWVRKLLIRGTGANADTDPASIINVQVRSSLVAQNAVNYRVANSGDFDIDVAVGLTGVRFDAIIRGTDHVELDGLDWALEPRPFGVTVSPI